MQYHKLVPMLLNEPQRQASELHQQRHVVTAQAEEIDRLRRDQAALRMELAQLTEGLARLARFETAATGR